MAFAVKRVYEAASAEDGLRVLVDRLWPRGVSRAKARIDLWAKDLAPSTGLRRWYKHDPTRWRGFLTRYFRELREQPEAVAELRKRSRQGKVTLLYGARDEQHNQAAALKAYLTRRGPRRPSRK